MLTGTHEFLARDGRTLDTILCGSDSGPALVCHHGTPSDGSLWLGWHDVAREHGLRLVAISRPGYATSTRDIGRTVASVASDVRDVLDALGVTSFVTAGWSGGGPHALACAALLGDRCFGVATLAGVAPWGAADLDWLDGMGPENIDEFGAALRGESALRAWLEANAAAFRNVTGPDIADAFGGLVPQIDKDILSGGFADAMATEMRRALARGFDGWIDDDLAFTRPWGFNIAAITVPVTVWQGDLDLMVPAAHGTWLAANVGSAHAKTAPGHGHVSLFAQFQSEIVRALRAGLPS